MSIDKKKGDYTPWHLPSLGFNAGEKDSGNSSEDVDKAYFGRLLNESIESFASNPANNELTNENDISKALIAHWKKDFSSRFGEDPSFPLVYQREVGIQKIKELVQSSKFNSSTSDPPPNSPTIVPTNRPVDTVRRMRVEFKAAEDQSWAQTPHPKLPVAAIGATHVTHSVQADRINMIVGGGAFLAMIVLALLLVLNAQHEKNVAIKLDTIQPHQTVMPNLDFYQVDRKEAPSIPDDPNMPSHNVTAPSTEHPEDVAAFAPDSLKKAQPNTSSAIRDSTTTDSHSVSPEASTPNTGESKNVANTVEPADAPFVPESLKLIPGKPQTSPSGDDAVVDPNLSASYFSETMEQRMERIRKQRELQKKAMQVQQQEQDHTQYNFFDQRQFVMPSTAKKFAEPAAVGDASIPTNIIVANPAVPSASKSN